MDALAAAAASAAGAVAARAAERVAESVYVADAWQDLPLARSAVSDSHLWSPAADRFLLAASLR